MLTLLTALPTSAASGPKRNRSLCCRMSAAEREASEKTYISEARGRADPQVGRLH